MRLPSGKDHMRKVVFLDRDGVINRDPAGWTAHSYVTEPEQFIFIDGALQAIRRLKEAEYMIFIVSNQAGIGKGFFSEEDLAAVNERMCAEIRRAGGDIDGTYYCVHQSSDGCDCRKPKPGLIKRALCEHNLSSRGGYIVGDSARDIEAGSAMGLTTILVLTGKTGSGEAESWKVKPDYVVASITEAAVRILEEA